MSLLPDQPPQTGAAFIPVDQSTSDGAATSQAHSDMLCRGSSVCASASSPSTPSASTSGPSPLPRRPVTHDQQPPPCLLLSSHGDDIKEDDDQHDQGSRGNEMPSTTDNKMLSVDIISHSHSSSSSSSSSSSLNSLDMSTADEAPVLPARSALRASRLMTPIPPEKTTRSDERPMLPHAAPHQLYLSSEEDASSSADDFSDFADEVDSDSEESQKTTAQRIGGEDTARMVEVVFHGKPSIITLSSRRSISPSSSNEHQTPPVILRTMTEPALSRPRSVHSSCSATTTLDPPPRSSSMLTAGSDKKRPDFLHIDPYAKGNDDLHELVRTPKTSSTMFRKTLNLVKKRSKSSLYQGESHTSPMEQVAEVGDERDVRMTICLDPPMASPAYQDAMKSARRNTTLMVPRSEPATPRSPKHLFRGGLSLSRQRSVRI
ncbi:hypothetical protein E4U41_002512 [Claviceps citrina]|nr:hypothetical protein E4U41_002512 [Claviceps citrina]